MSPPLRRRRRRRADLSFRTVVDVARGIPRFAVLLGRLVRDPRVSRLDRVLFGAALAYLFVPWDLVPDWVPGLGRVDDLLLVILALYRLLHRTDRDVLLEHWGEDAEPLLVLEDLLDRAVGAAPWWTRRLVEAG